MAVVVARVVAPVTASEPVVVALPIMRPPTLATVATKLEKNPLLEVLLVITDEDP